MLGLLLLIIWLIPLVAFLLKIALCSELVKRIQKGNRLYQICAAICVVGIVAWGGVKPNMSMDSNSIDEIERPSDNLIINSVGENISHVIQSESIDSNASLDLGCFGFSEEEISTGFILTGVSTNEHRSFSIPTNGVAYEPWLKYGASDDVFIYEQDTPIMELGTNAYNRARIYSQGSVQFEQNLMVNVLDVVLGISPTNNWCEVESPMLWYLVDRKSTIFTWHDVLLNRISEANVSFQLEIKNSGDIIAHYDRRTVEFIKAGAVDFDISVLNNNIENLAYNNTCSTTNHTCASIYNFSSNGGVNVSHLCEIINECEVGISLYWTNISNLNHTSSDEDNDGISNFEEICIYKTDCYNADTDGDNRSDSHEVQNGFSAVNADENNDSVPDGIDSDEWASHPLWCTNNTPSIIISLDTPIPAGTSASLMLNDLTIPLSETNSWSLTLPQGELVNVRLQSTGTEPIDLSLSYPNSDTQNYNNSVWIDDPAGIFDGAAYNAEAQIAKPTYDIYVEGSKIEQNYCAHSDEIYFDINVYPSEIELDFSKPDYIDSRLEYVSNNRFKSVCSLNKGEGYSGLISFGSQVDYNRLDIYIEYHKCDIQFNGKCSYEGCDCSIDYSFGIDIPNLVMLRSQQNLIELKATHSLGETTAIDWEITPVVNDGAKLHVANGAADSGSTYIYQKDKVYVTAGDNLGEYIITARLSEYPEVTATSTLKVIDVYCELICNKVDPTYGVINPAYVVNGMDSMFKAWIEPAVLVSNSNINASWSASNSNVSIISNSLEKLVVRGNDLGECSLTLNIDDAQFITPQINTKVVNMVTNTIHACYNLGTTNVVNMTDLRVDFSNRLEVVNQIYKQVGMYFVAGVVTNQVNDEWCVITENSKGRLLTDYNMFNIFGEERGLRVCFVDDICVKKYSGFHSRGRIVLRKDASSISFGHEIGHGCKMPDIYTKVGTLNVDEMVNKLLIPNDCTGTETIHFYNEKNQKNLIHKLLMYGYKNDMKIDISFGDIYGIWYEWELGSKIYHKSLDPIGFETNGTRNLTIYGGDY